MAKNDILVKQEKKKNIFQILVEYRKLIMLILLFVLVPVSLVTGVYVSEYIDTKSNPYAEYDKVSASYFDDKFTDFQIYVGTYTRAEFDFEDTYSDGTPKLLKSGSIDIKTEVGSVVEGSGIVAADGVDFEFTLAADWNETTYKGYSSNTPFNDTYMGNSSISSVNFLPKISPLWLITVTEKSYKMHVKISWTVKDKDTGYESYETVRMLLSYNQYIDKTKTIFK